MVVAYNPNGKYASQFKAIADGSKPVSDLFTLLQTPGLKLGRTDPNIDPQGRDFIYMLQLAQMYYHLPSDTVAKILGTSDYGTADVVADLRRVRAGLHAAVGPAGRGQRLRHPGDRAAPGLHPAAGPDQPGQRRPGRPVQEGVRYAQERHDQARVAAGDRHHHHRHAYPGWDRIRQVHAVAGGPGPVQARRVLVAYTERCSGRRARCPQKSRVSWAASPAAAAGGADPKLGGDDPSGSGGRAVRGRGASRRRRPLSCAQAPLR